METIEINLPQQGSQLNKAGLYLLMQAKQAGATPKAVFEFIYAVLPKKKVEQILSIPEEQKQEVFFQINEAIKPLFAPVSSLPANFKIKSKALPDPHLSLFTFGEWCLLAETLQTITQAEEPTQEQINTINALMLKKQHGQALDINSIFPKQKIGNIQQLLVVDYALGCLNNIIKMDQYSTLFEPEKKENTKTTPPTFGWFSVANDLANKQAFGSHSELLSTNMHQVLIYMTDQKEKQSKETVKNELQTLKDK